MTWPCVIKLSLAALTLRTMSSFLTLKTNLRTCGYDKRLNVLSFASDIAKFTFIYLLHTQGHYCATDWVER